MASFFLALQVGEDILGGFSLPNVPAVSDEGSQLQVVAVQSVSP
jgi:hypothetical protein